MRRKLVLSGSGRYVTYAVQDDGDLVFTPTPEFFQDYDDISSSGSTVEQLEVLLEDLMVNGELDWVWPEEIGALTDAPVLSDYVRRDDEGKILKLGKVWWHAQYQIEDPVEALYEQRELRLAAAPRD